MAATYDDTTPINATAVAVDKDNKNSNTAVRWAIDHLVISNPYLILIHVKQKSHNYDGDGGEIDHYSVFLPFRGYCARKGIQMKEVLLEDNDVAKALLDYISSNYINNIVVGASTRNALTRRLKGLDVSSSLSKAAPEFCSVYVVHKGKMLSVRTARRCWEINPPPSKY